MPSPCKGERCQGNHAQGRYFLYVDHDILQYACLDGLQGLKLGMGLKFFPSFRR